MEGRGEGRRDGKDRREGEAREDKPRDREWRGRGERDG